MRQLIKDKFYILDDTGDTITTVVESIEEEFEESDNQLSRRHLLHLS